MPIVRNRLNLKENILRKYVKIVSEKHGKQQIIRLIDVSFSWTVL